MLKMHIELEGNTALEVADELKELLSALETGTEKAKPSSRKKGGSTTAANNAANTPVPMPTAPAPGPAPVPMPAVPTPGPAPVPMPTAPATTAIQTPPVASTPVLPPAAPATTATTAVQAPSAAPAPVPTTPAITLEAISVAGSSLIDAGKMDDVMALIARYGVQTITQLKESDYPAFAAELRALGAKI